jgi:hypothetical protein
MPRRSGLSAAVERVQAVVVSTETSDGCVGVALGDCALAGLGLHTTGAATAGNSHELSDVIRRLCAFVWARHGLRMTAKHAPAMLPSGFNHRLGQAARDGRLCYLQCVATLPRAVVCETRRCTFGERTPRGAMPRGPGGESVAPAAPKRSRTSNGPGLALLTMIRPPENARRGPIMFGRSSNYDGLVARAQRRGRIGHRLVAHSIGLRPPRESPGLQRARSMFRHPTPASQDRPAAQLVPKLLHPAVL